MRVHRYNVIMHTISATLTHARMSVSLPSAHSGAGLSLVAPPASALLLQTCMSKSCSGILDEYITCVADSACVKARLARVCRGCRSVRESYPLLLTLGSATQGR